MGTMGSAGFSGTSILKRAACFQWVRYALSSTSFQRNFGQLSVKSCGFFMAQFYLAFRQLLMLKPPTSSVRGNSLDAPERGKVPRDCPHGGGERKAPGNSLISMLSLIKAKAGNRGHKPCSCLPVLSYQHQPRDSTIPLPTLHPC